jgi:Carboxypeptidase regulatory-like domain
MYRALVISCAAMLSGIALGQSGSQVATAPTFHVRGTIDSMTNGAIPRVEVSFVSDNTSRTVAVDDSGFYQIDLPLGTYTMTANFPRYGLTKYVRFFRVQGPTTITMNGSLYGDYSCDGVWVGKDEKERVELYKDSCGGEDSFLFPSEDGVPLRLDIRYVRRERTEKLVSYSSNTALRRPILVAYNLFALQADSVDYDREGRAIRAYGNVIFQDQSGTTHVASAAFRFNDGKATRIW